MQSKRDLWLLSGATLLIHLTCLTQYGWFRDELYYVACSHHLDWGYVDQPPMIALVAWIARHLFGETLWGIRLVSAVAGACIVFLTGMLARRMGANRFAQNIAALCSMIAPMYLAAGHFLSMNVFEPLVWMSMAYIAIAIFDGGDERLWLLFGVLAGLGLENKHSTLFFGSSFVIAMLLTPQRKHFARKWIWLGGVLAALIFLPNVLWEVQHHFATYELLSNIAHGHKNAEVTPLSFFLGQLLLMHPLTLPIWILGIIWLIRRPNYRVLGLTFVILFIEFVVMKGKIYYLAPAYPMLFAAGAISVGQALSLSGWSRLSRWGRQAESLSYTILVMGGALLAPYVIPILPVETFIRYEQALHVEPPKTENHAMGPLPQQYADMFGWPEMVAAVARAYDMLTPAEKAKCAIFAQNYGQAGAIDHFGPQYGLPHAISGHQSYFLWGPQGATGEVLIVLDDNQETLEELFNDVRPAGDVTHPLNMPYEHWTIHICRGPKQSMAELWPKVKKWM
ncbi:MAG TPA: glycosyltransferase family 39 protein [Thermoanaerobaculia bacterium]|nr:glycosyltransferase family 39 protein [Thermoanaerobaculia bacterium]